MPRAALILADGFEEIEAVTIADVLRRAEIETVLTGVSADLVAGNHGIALRTDRRLDDVLKDRWDLVVLPGGMPGAGTLREDPRVQALIKTQHERHGKLAAICAAPIALARAGVLEGRRATCYPTFREQLGGVNYVEEDVVIDGDIITSRGPATAMAFALALVEALRGHDAKERVAERMLVSAPQAVS